MASTKWTQLYCTLGGILFQNALSSFSPLLYRSFDYILWYLILFLRVFCMSQHLYVHFCAFYLALVFHLFCPILFFVCFVLSVILGYYFYCWVISPDPITYFEDACLYSNKRERKVMDFSGWSSGENLRGDRGRGNNSQNVLYEINLLSIKRNKLCREVEEGKNMIKYIVRNSQRIN